ncbi:uncharacterized protein PG986_011632 [Apiospora aurea]|uniref:Uncharacterized protein n=1 Tax=Apiospora aurea TaxID=335848 RepID=A0ABR1PY22_9PEZI
MPIVPSIATSAPGDKGEAAPGSITWLQADYQYKGWGCAVCFRTVLFQTTNSIRYLFRYSHRRHRYPYIISIIVCGLRPQQTDGAHLEFADCCDIASNSLEEDGREADRGVEREVKVERVEKETPIEPKGARSMEENSHSREQSKAPAAHGLPPPAPGLFSQQELPPPKQQLIATTGYPPPPPLTRPHSQPPQTIRHSTPFGHYSGSGPFVATMPPSRSSSPPQPPPYPHPPVQFEPRRFPQTSAVVRGPPPPASSLPSKRPQSTQTPPPFRPPPQQRRSPAVAPPGTINPSDLLSQRPPQGPAAPQVPGPARPASNPPPPQQTKGRAAPRVPGPGCPVSNPPPLQQRKPSMQPQQHAQLQYHNESQKHHQHQLQQQQQQPTQLAVHQTAGPPPIDGTGQHDRDAANAEVAEFWFPEMDNDYFPSEFLASEDTVMGGTAPPPDTTWLTRPGGQNTIPRFYQPCDFCVWLKAQTGKGGQCHPSFRSRLDGNGNGGRDVTAHTDTHPVRPRCTTCDGFGIDECTVSGTPTPTAPPPPRARLRTCRTRRSRSFFLTRRCRRRSGERRGR